MSNQQVGNVYQQIIEEVINASRSDFEEQGVEDSILLDLRKGWQHKLTSLRIADFPWDPKPESQSTPGPAQQQQQQPVAQQQAQPSQPAQQPADQYAQTQQSTQPQHPFSLPQNPVVNGAQVKQEPGIATPASRQQGEPRVKQEPGTGHPSLPTVGTVPDRVIENLKNKYGDSAAATISHIQHINHTGSNFTHPQSQQQQRPAPPQQQQQQQSQQNAQANQYHHAMQQQLQVQMRQQQQQASGSMRQHQNDGASDPDETHEGVLVRDGAELGRVEVDGLLHSQIAAAGREMEGGGLMVSLKPATKGTMRAKKAELGLGPTPSAASGPPSSAIAHQGDGAMDEDDDEAINSDLDDPEDDKDSDDDDDEGGNVMLCVYDKVQRVKNKWKCTLKDGVLTVNGREYVFHKAQGEFEW